MIILIYNNFITSTVRKKRTSTEADANSIGANNSNRNWSINNAENQSRIDMAMNIFNSLFSRIPGEHFSYLMVLIDSQSVKTTGATELKICIAL